MRIDPLTGEPVLMAPARADRPHDISGPSSAAAGCPFCPGNEATTPPETFAVRPGGEPSDSGGWLVRAVPNKFPAIGVEEGIHEVVVNSPRHVSSLSDLSSEEAERAVATWAERLEAAAADPRQLAPFLFLNQGARAGASLVHTHAQIVGLPFTPARLLAREAAFVAAERSPLLGDVSSDRTVAEYPGLVAWCPAVPPLSGTIRLAPTVPRPDWRRDLDVAAVAAAVVHLVGSVQDRLGTEDINLCLYERPPDGTDRYHWHLDVVPRLGTLAGLELGTGIIAVNRAPRDVALALRS